MITNFYNNHNLIASKNIEAPLNKGDYVCIGKGLYSVQFKELDLTGSIEQMNIYLRYLHLHAKDRK